MRNHKKHLAIALFALGTLGSAWVQAQTPTRVRGEIVSADAQTLVVHSRTGETITLAMKPDAGVATVKNVSLADIKAGAFIGTATRSGSDGKLVALEVVVFPEAARGTGEGHYGWDLLPGSMMTNANVDRVVEGVKGRDITLSYKGGSQLVSVPENVPVVTVVPGALADLQAGKKVFVVAMGEPGKLTAARIIVEKDGVVPPM